MPLKGFFVRGKLKRLHREERKLHALQKRVRRRLEDLEEERDKGLDKAKYADRKASLDGERRHLVERLAQVEAEQKALREELKSLEASA